MINRVSKELHDMLSKGDKCIAAVSGGADSTALLLLLAEFRDVLGIDVRVVHVHHGLRGDEADRDAAFVVKTCERLKLPCRIIKVDVHEFAAKHKMSTEEAGRYLRYQKLEEEADSWEAEQSENIDGEPGRVKIAVAHNQDDNAETILMQLARGSGLKGLSGIQPERGRIIRPLLNISREEIENYLKSEGAEWINDSTNEGDEYTRNRIRHDILPRLTQAVNAGAVENITRAGRMAGMADEYLSEQAGRLVYEHARRIEGGYGIPLNIFLAQPLIIRTYMIRALMERMDSPMKDVTSIHIEDIAALAENETGKRIDLPYGLKAAKGYEMLELYRNSERDESCAGNPEKKFVMRKFPYNNGNIPELQYTKWFDYDKINAELDIRTRQPGDYLILKGVGRKSLNTYMTDVKIPQAKRDEIPVVACEDHVLWLVGHRISEAYKVDENTRTVLEIIYKGDDEDERDS